MGFLLWGLSANPAQKKRTKDYSIDDPLVNTYGIERLPEPIEFFFKRYNYENII